MRSQIWDVEKGSIGAGTTPLELGVCFVKARSVWSWTRRHDSEFAVSPCAFYLNQRNVTLPFPTPKSSLLNSQTQKPNSIRILARISFVPTPLRVLR